MLRMEDGGPESVVEDAAEKRAPEAVAGLP
jgi:hypothetical protein